jgi:hypothetical protein
MIKPRSHTLFLPAGWTWAVVCDLDGTLSNPAHRRHYVEGPGPSDWHEFALGIKDDTLVTPVASAFHLLQTTGVLGVLVTARSILDHTATVEWLARHKIQYDHLFMRAANDSRADRVVKYDILCNMRNKFQIEPWIALDDRDNVVDMWRAEGITCFQVADGDF